MPKVRVLMKIFLVLIIYVSLTTYLLYKLNQSYSYKKIKYILQWTNSTTEPFIFMGVGQKEFLKRHCPVNNCYITSQRNLLRYTSYYDAILFHGPDLWRYFWYLPEGRSPKQKYIFVSVESPVNYPLHNFWYDGTFNWTWSYKINSDIDYRYIIIKNKKGRIIGPQKNMHWLKIQEMKGIDDSIKNKLKNKKIAAAWFVSQCGYPRYNVAEKLSKELSLYNMTLDVYGECGTKNCPKTNMSYCLSLIERDYFFYLSFENTLCEDYVTEKLLHAVQHYAVPIVYSGANYTRFMPNGTYLDVRLLGTKDVANRMVKAIKNKEIYYDFFKWHNHYSYHSSEEFPETDPLCQLCKKVNDQNAMNKITVYEEFRKWWNV